MVAFAAAREKHENVVGCAGAMAQLLTACDPNLWRWARATDEIPGPEAPGDAVAGSLRDPGRRRSPRLRAARRRDDRMKASAIGTASSWVCRPLPLRLRRRAAPDRFRSHLDLVQQRLKSIGVAGDVGFQPRSPVIVLTGDGG